MPASDPTGGARRNIALYPWFKFFQNLIFWQAIWFLYFQDTLSAAAAILLYVVYDVTTTVLEVPSGYMSDRLGRRITLIAATLCGALGSALLAFGDSFATFALAQALLGSAAALASGTDSAILYESLSADGREDDVEAQELRAWRFTFSALALSAVTGGAMALVSGVLPFVAATLAFVGALIVNLRLTEPAHAGTELPQGAELVRLGSLRAALTEPVLVWLFALSVVMYGFSHLPFIFGQPFILEVLGAAGLAAEAPLVSGAVSSVMMLLSVAASLVALRLRSWMGLPAILLLAFGMQIALAGVLALTDSAVAIAFLFLRMVPDSLSRPFILARIQPMLRNDSRATYLSLQSLVGRLLFAATLYAAAGATTDTGAMPHAEIRQILGWYVAGGMAILAMLALAARRVTIDRPARRGDADASHKGDATARDPR